MHLLSDMLPLVRVYWCACVRPSNNALDAARSGRQKRYARQARAIAAHYAEQQRSSPDAPAAAASSSPPLFEHGDITHTHLSTERRWFIILLHKMKREDAAIAKEVTCDIRSVRHWINHYQEYGNVDDLHRSGRKRKTTADQDATINHAAKRIKFTTPRRIKRKLGLDVSSRTIDRRLIEVGLFGRVAQHKKKYTEEHIRKRLSFAEGYTNWTAEQWMKVMFADEKIFWGEGFWGQVFVRRPKGEALNPDYCVDRDPHPEKVNVWGCFCGHGLGYCYIFNENMDGQLLKGILGTHLIESVPPARPFEISPSISPAKSSPLACSFSSSARFSPKQSHPSVSPPASVRSSWPAWSGPSASASAAPKAIPSIPRAIWARESLTRFYPFPGKEHQIGDTRGYRCLRRWSALRLPVTRCDFLSSRAVSELRISGRPTCSPAPKP